MKMIRILITCLLMTGSYVLAQEPQTLPGVPISQEHHHHLVLENSYVKAYEVEVAPHESTLMHQHLHDYVYVVFGDAEFTNAAAGKPEVKVKAPDLTVNFSPGPFAHVAVNNSHNPFRNITIELLHPQGEVKKFYPTLVAALSGTPNGERKLEPTTVLETQEVRVQAVGIAPKSTWAAPVDGHTRLMVITGKIFDTSGKKEANSPFAAGMLVWVPAGKQWSTSNDAMGIEKLMVLEFKD